MKVREVIAFKNYFEKFLLAQPEKIQNKIFRIIKAIETLERILCSTINVRVLRTKRK